MKAHFSFFAVAAFCTVFLSACSGGELEQSLVNIRAEYLKADVSLTADVRADYGDRCYDYTLSYTGDGNTGTVKVIAPEIIDDISAKISESGSFVLSCGDTLIDTGEICATGYSPLETLPIIVSAIRTGYAENIYGEGLDGEDCIVAEINISGAGEREKTICTLWFSDENHDLIKAEIAVNGFTVLSAKFREV